MATARPQGQQEKGSAIMITTIIILAVLAGFLAGIAAHQRVMINEARFQISADHEAEVAQAEIIGGLRAWVTAHETSLTMMLNEAGK